MLQYWLTGWLANQRQSLQPARDLTDRVMASGLTKVLTAVRATNAQGISVLAVIYAVRDNLFYLLLDFI